MTLSKERGAAAGAIAKGEASALGRAAAGRLLAAIRVRAGLSQGELAAKVSEVHSTFISQVETGRATLPSNKIGAFALAVGVDRSELAVQLLAFYDPGIFSAIFDLEPSEAFDPRELEAPSPIESTPSLLTDLVRRLDESETPLETNELLGAVKAASGVDLKRTTLYLMLYRLWKRGRIGRNEGAWTSASRSAEQTARSPGR